MPERPEAEIEDVLSSIRRLVAGDHGASAASLAVVPQRAPKTVAVTDKPAPDDSVSKGPMKDGAPTNGAATSVHAEHLDPTAKTPENKVAKAPEVGAFVLTPESRVAAPEAPPTDTAKAEGRPTLAGRPSVPDAKRDNSDPARANTAPPSPSSASRVRPGAIEPDTKVSAASKGAALSPDGQPFPIADKPSSIVGEPSTKTVAPLPEKVVTDTPEAHPADTLRPLVPGAGREDDGIAAQDRVLPPHGSQPKANMAQHATGASTEQGPTSKIEASPSDEAAPMVEDVPHLGAPSADITDVRAVIDHVSYQSAPTVAEPSEDTDDILREDVKPSVDGNPMDMSSPVARAAMTARLGAMRAQWESDAAAETEVGALDDAPDGESPAERGEVTPDADETVSDTHQRRMRLSPSISRDTADVTAEFKGSSEPDRRPIWSRVQPAIERAVRESLDPGDGAGDASDFDDMLLETGPEPAAPLARPDRRVPPTDGVRPRQQVPHKSEPVDMPRMPVRARSRAVEAETDSDFPENLFGPETGLESAEVRAMVVKIVHEELQGALGERITRNVRKLVRREIQRALASRDFD